MEKTKKCKHCQSEIDAKAKVCPNCRKKQGGKMKGILIVIALFIIIGAIASQQGDDEAKLVNKNGTDASTAKTEEKTSFNVGETASLKDIAVTLVGITESTGSEYNTPADGKVFILCEFTIENNSSKDIAVSSAMSFEAYCDDYSINQSITGLLEKGDKAQLDGSVAAGKKMNGVIAYEVPTDWAKVEINFTPDFWSGKDIKFIASK